MSSRRCKGSVLDVVADRLLGVRAGDIMGIVSIISLAASISAMTFAGPRVYYAMARDGLFFQRAARDSSALQDAGHRDRRAGGLGRLLVLSGSATRSPTTPVSPWCCSRAWRSRRCSCCARASRMRRVRSRRGAIRWRPAIFAICERARSCSMRSGTDLSSPIRNRHGTGVRPPPVDHHRPGHSDLLLLLPSSSTSGRRTDSTGLQPDAPYPQCAARRRHRSTLQRPQRQERQRAVRRREQQERLPASRGSSSRAGTRPPRALEERAHHPQVAAIAVGSRHGRA